MTRVDVYDETRTIVDHAVDLLTVVLISLATVATAWCGYQAARWSSLQALDYSRANAARIEAAVAAGRANSDRLIDVALFVQYENALFQRNDAFAAFIDHRFRPEFRKAIDAWDATKPQTNPRAPLSPFVMKEYHLQSDDRSASASKRADAFVAQAVTANQTSDSYVFVTVLFASVTFLGGVATKTRYPWHVVLVIIGIVLILLAVLRTIHYPIR